MDNGVRREEANGLKFKREEGKVNKREEGNGKINQNCVLEKFFN
jgi:hypothetical protein